MSLVCAIIALIYFAINLPKLKIKSIREKFIYNIVFILCISSFFWLPMFTNSISTRYEVYEPEKMATAESVQNSGLKLKQLVITLKDGSYVFEFGPHILIMLCFTIASFRRITPEIKREYIFFFIVGILSTFMATKYFPWKIFGNKLSMIQFAWRMMEISCFCFSIVCSINLGIIIKNFKFIDAIVLGVIAVIYVFALRNFVPTTNQEIKAPSDFDYEYVTGRNTDCLIGMGKNEYLPKKAYDNYFYLATRENDIVVLEGNAKIENYKKDGNKLEAEIEVFDDKTLVELPYLYYSGYTVTLDGSKIPAFENKNGFLAIGLNKLSKSDLKVEYTGTTVMKVANIFSVVSTILFIGYVISLKFQKEDKNVEN